MNDVELVTLQGPASTINNQNRKDKAMQLLGNDIRHHKNTSSSMNILLLKTKKRIFSLAPHPNNDPDECQKWAYHIADCSNSPIEDYSNRNKSSDSTSSNGGFGNTTSAAAKEVTVVKDTLDKADVVLREGWLQMSSSKNGRSVRRHCVLHTNALTIMKMKGRKPVDSIALDCILDVSAPVMGKFILFCYL